MTPHAIPNQWAGHDFHGPDGIVRDTVEDGERHIYRLTANGVECWHAIFTMSTPGAVFESALLAALAEVGA